MTKTELHRLVDALPEGSFEAAAIFLRPLVAGALVAANDDENFNEDNEQPLPGATIRLTVRTLDDDYVLVEGDSETLFWLAKLFASRAQAPSLNCGRQFAPNGPGNAFFSQEATHGLYIHRLPCYKETLDPS